MGLAAVALLAAGGLTAVSQIQQGKIAEAQGKFAKEIAVRNQKALERQAKAEREVASIEEKRAARQEKLIKGRQRAVIGKTGTGLAGATLSALTDTVAQFSIERNLILRRGLIRGRELRERGKIQLAKGRFAFTLGRQAKKLSFVKAGASILGGVSQSGLFDKPTSFIPKTKAGLFTPGGARGIKAAWLG